MYALQHGPSLLALPSPVTKSSAIPASLPAFLCPFLPAPHLSLSLIPFSFLPFFLLLISISSIFIRLISGHRIALSKSMLHIAHCPGQTTHHTSYVTHHTSYVTHHTPHHALPPSCPPAILPFFLPPPCLLYSLSFFAPSRSHTVHRAQNKYHFLPFCPFVILPVFLPHPFHTP